MRALALPLRLMALAAAVLLPLAWAAAEEVPGGMRKFLGEKRLLIVFAPSIGHPSYNLQTRELVLNASGAAERDLLLVEVVGDEPVRVEALSDREMEGDDLRTFYRVEAGEFRVILLDKDGAARLSAEETVPAGELFSAIDSR